jgi:hypothetical protein
MLLVYWIAAALTGLIGFAIGRKYTETPNLMNLALGLIFLAASACMVYMAMTTKA